MKSNKRLTIRLTPGEKSALQKKAEDLNTSVSSIVRDRINGIKNYDLFILLSNGEKLALHDLLNGQIIREANYEK